MFEKIGLLALGLDLVAIVAILRSSFDGATRRLWTIFVILLPFIGAIFYFALGARRPILRSL